jgi:hypothetical protein
MHFKDDKMPDLSFIISAPQAKWMRGREQKAGMGQSTNAPACEMLRLHVMRRASPERGRLRG